MDKFCCWRYNSLYLMFNKEKARRRYCSKNGIIVVIGSTDSIISHKFMWELHWAVMYLKILL